MMMIALLQRSFLAQENVIQLIKSSQFHGLKFHYRDHKSHLWILGLISYQMESALENLSVLANTLLNLSAGRLALLM
jgi:hypothetical protein